jgi:cardiolipin synthase
MTVPNLISLGRLLCVPLFLWLLWGADEPIAAAALLAVLGATDWVDGWIARRYDQGSDLGKVLDPTADRVLLVTGCIALLVEDLPVGVEIMVWVILMREIVVAVATIALAFAGARRIDVVWAGKAGTLALMFALPMFLGADAVESDVWRVLLAIAGWGFAIAGIGLGYYAVTKYIPAAREALREGRTTELKTEVQG